LLSTRDLGRSVDTILTVRRSNRCVFVRFPSGKLFDAIKPTADQTGLFNNLRGIIPAARATGIQVFIVPHHRLLEGDFDGWQHVNMFQKAGLPTRAFAVGTWGGEFNGLHIRPGYAVR